MRGILTAGVEALLWPWGIRRKRNLRGKPPDSGQDGRPADDDGNYNWEVDLRHFLGATTGALLGWWAYQKLRGTSSAQLTDAGPPASSIVDTIAAAVVPRMPLSEFLHLLRAGAITAVTYCADRQPAGALVVKTAVPLAAASVAAAPQLLGAQTPAAPVTTAETLLLPGCHEAVFEELRQQRGVRFECADVGAGDLGFGDLSLLVDLGGLAVSLAAVWYLLRSGTGGMFSGKKLENADSDGADRRPAVTFDDVAGMENTKEELKEVISFLRNPRGFYALGARPPRGLLLAGPSGTGKTLLARAVAGEAGVPFLYASSAAFVEVFVGQGAQRIRQFFEQARASAPCIVFLDELDAVGAARQAGGSGGNQEYAQTLNQLLLELDGIESHSSSHGELGTESAPMVFTIAATNRYDCLDEALVRPGRLDRCVLVSLPNVAERLATLKIHARKLRTEGVDFEALARCTEGWSGADLSNLLNEAALLAARRGAEAVRAEHVQETLAKPRPSQRGRGQGVGGGSGAADGASPDHLFAGLLAAAAAVMQQNGGSAAPATGAGPTIDLMADGNTVD